MFPSSGYFRGLDCPFYASGLCERPYCHYRHAKQPSEKDPNWIGKSTPLNQKLNHLGDTLLLDADRGPLIEKTAHLKEVEKPFSKPTYSCISNKDHAKLYTYKPLVVLPCGPYDKANDSCLDSSKYKTYTKYNCDGKSNYQPSCDNQIRKGRYEEYTVSKKKEKKVNEYNCDIASNSVPEYNPTPISELKRMHRYSTQSVTHSDLEYDPVSNFDAGFSNKSFFNLSDNSSYPSNQPAAKLTTGHSVYKPTKIPSDDDYEHELVIDAKFSDDSDEEAVTCHLPEQESDNETKDSLENVSYLTSNKPDNNCSTSSYSPLVSHENKHNSKEAVLSLSKPAKTDSKSSNHEKSNKTSKSTNNVKKHTSSETTDNYKCKSTLDDRNKLEKNKQSSQDKISKKPKTTDSHKSSSLDKKSSSEKKSCVEKKVTSEKKVSSSSSSSSSSKRSSIEKKVSSSHSKSSTSSSSTLQDQSSIVKSKKESYSKEKPPTEKIKKIKESKNEREVNGTSEKDRSIRDKEHRKSQSDHNCSSTKKKLKDESKTSSSSSSLVIKKSSGEHGVKKTSSQSDLNKVKLKELERRKSDTERRTDSKTRELEAKPLDIEKKKDTMSLKNSLSVKKKVSDHHNNNNKKSSRDSDLTQIIRQEIMLTKIEKQQKMKELNERVEIWKANHTDHKNKEKIPEKIRKTEHSSKFNDYTKKKLTHSSSESIKHIAPNNVIQKSKKRECPSSENFHEHPSKMIKKDERHGYYSSSDEGRSSKKVKNRSTNHSSGKRPSGVIKDKKNRSIRINDLFGEESSEDDGEESGGALGQSGGDESTGVSDDNDFNVIFGETDLSENDPYEECLRIFNESNSQTQQQQQQRQQQAKAAELAKRKEIIELPPVEEGKKRVAHPGAASRVANDRLKKFVRPALVRPSPVQVMQNRFLEKQKRLAEESKIQKEKSLTNLPSNQSKLSLLKHRMSVPTVGLPESCTLNSNRTIIGTAAKTEKRTAHVPKKHILKRPTITADCGSYKITVGVRQRYLNLIFDECIRIVSNQNDAMDVAVTEEIKIYKGCTSKLGYLNKAIHLIKRLRNNNLDLMKESDSEKFPDTPKLEQILTGRELYERLRNYVLTEQELQENHFPRPAGAGRAKFYLADITTDPHLPSDERFCVRCTRTYRVDSLGKSLVPNECMYHWARPARRMVGNSYEIRHRCCQGESGSSGCEVAPCHVHHKNKFDGSTGYMSTPRKTMPDTGPGVYAMDCEMVYTTVGMEVARVTVVNSECMVVYETFVKPEHEILDYNTRFSGITEEDLRNVQTTLIQVQAVLMLYFSSDSIIVGHSLESDLMAVKLIHNNVVDTSVLFPHRIGRPFKRALKNLTFDYLNTTIQEGVGGHDSKEDAIAAMRLVHYRLRQDGNRSRQ